MGHQEVDIWRNKPVSLGYSTFKTMKPTGKVLNRCQSDEDMLQGKCHKIYKLSQRDICMLQMVNHCEQEQCSWCFFPIKKRSLQLTKKKNKQTSSSFVVSTSSVTGEVYWEYQHKQQRYVFIRKTAIVTTDFPQHR